MPQTIVNVDIKDNTHLEEQLPKLQSNIVSISAEMLRTALTTNSPYDTGHLQRSWRYSIGTETVIAINSAKYARYVNDGRGPVHVKKAKALKFMKGGKIVGFAKSARATRGQKFVEKSIQELEGQIPNILSQALNKL